jgi:hypothetical protein
MELSARLVQDGACACPTVALLSCTIHRNTSPCRTDIGPRARTQSIISILSFFLTRINAMEFLYRYSVLSVLKTFINQPQHIRDLEVSADMMLKCEGFFGGGGCCAKW